jgi:hypothetical protein
MHAIAEFASHYWDVLDYSNQTVVVLEVKYKWQLEEWERRLEDQDKTYRSFHEPDLENELTAIACLDEGEIFKKLNLVSQ